MAWSAFEADYALLRDRIAAVVAGFEDFNARLAAEAAGFVLRHPPRDERRFPTATGRAQLTVNPLEVLRVPPGRLLLQTMRSHDQYNTTIYGLNDRYRGIKADRRVVLVHPDDLAERGLEDGTVVDIVSEWHDGERRIERFRAVAYPTARGCVAAYYAETNPLVPLDHHAEGSAHPRPSRSSCGSSRQSRKCRPACATALIGAFDPRRSRGHYPPPRAVGSILGPNVPGISLLEPNREAARLRGSAALVGSFGI
jgi:anaerobic selenocysteine-containing dehydrogenase